MRLFSTGCALALAGGLAAQAPASSIPKNDRDVLKAMLRQIKEDLTEHYYDTRFRGLDVNTAFGDAETKLEAATDISQAMTLLVEPLWQLDDSHTSFYPPNRSVRVDYGWQMAMVGDRALIVDVKPGSDAAAKGLEAGDRVLFLNRYQPDRANLWQIGFFYRFVRVQALQRLIVMKPDGSTKTLEIQSAVTQHPMTQFEDLLDEIESRWRAARDREAVIEPATLVWKMMGFRTEDQMQAAMKRARDAKALVLDLRGNGGGAVAALRQLVSLVMDHDVHVATELGREKTTPVTVKPVSHPFTGTLVVLVDSQSASASEVFARVVQLEHRGTVIGDRTAGAVMESQVFPHHAGLRAMAFYATSITIADLQMSDGASLEHAGVQPDEILLPSPADLAARRDPALSRALELTGVTMSPERAGRLFDGLK